MLKRVLTGAIIVFLIACSTLIVQTVINRYYADSIILVQSDLFKGVSYIKLEELIKDENVKSLFTREDKIDVDFKIALFYSDLSIVILNKSKAEPKLKKYVNSLYTKSVGKWDELTQKDKSMLFFKNYYIKVYAQNLKNNTN